MARLSVSLRARAQARGLGARGRAGVPAAASGDHERAQGPGRCGSSPATTGRNGLRGTEETSERRRRRLPPGSGGGEVLAAFWSRWFVGGSHVAGADRQGGVLEWRGPSLGGREAEVLVPPTVRLARAPMGRASPDSGRGRDGQEMGWAGPGLASPPTAACEMPGASASFSFLSLADCGSGVSDFVCLRSYF